MNVSHPLLLHVTGSRACFRRSEFATDFVSYDVLPPLTAQRLINGICPLPEGRWSIRTLTVLNRIEMRWDCLVTARGERRALLLTDVAYVIEAIADGTVETVEAAVERLSIGQPLKAHLGLPEFGAKVAPLGPGEMPRSALIGTGDRDLGWLPERLVDGKPAYQRTVMSDGVIDLARQDCALRAA